MKTICSMVGAMVMMAPLSYANENPSSPFGVEVNVAPTISSNQDSDWLSGSVLGLYQLDDWQVGIGAKLRHASEGHETVSDVQLRYRAYQGDQWGFDLGGGLEGTQPKLTYQMVYQASPQWSLRAGFNTVFDDDEENRLEAVFGFNYFFAGEKPSAPMVVKEEPVKEPVVVETPPKREIKPKPKPKPKYYVVKKGDWLHLIAQRLNTDVDTLLQLNSNIKNRNLIYPGQRLRYRLEQEVK